jgi:hydroxymethylpyrimidine/phosphomethylpyrimidine kinase
MKPVALTIAGSDPSGGAGIQADLKTFHQFGVYGMSVITLVTVQNTQSVTAVELIAPGLVDAQLEAVLDDIPPDAAKTGALGGADIIEAVARQAAAFRFPLVVDPVMISKHGQPLLAEDARAALIERLLPAAFLVTPNLQEAGVLAGMDVHDLASMEEAARRIAAQGAASVLVKGGHLAGNATDVLYYGGAFHRFTGPRVETRHTHGTGCTYSAAITAGLAQGLPLLQAIETAKRFITLAIQSGPALGRGCGPVNHHARIEPLSDTHGLTRTNTD